MTSSSRRPSACEAGKLSMLPAALVLMTSFTRIVIVLSILRQALGTAQTPSNQILIGLALFLTFFIMGPVLSEVYATALQPYLAEEMGAQAAFEAAQIPVREFMMAQTRPWLRTSTSEKLVRCPPLVPPSMMA